MGNISQVKKEKQMFESKTALSSTTIWGTIITSISAILLISGVKIAGLDDPALPMALSALFGALLSLYGRIKATTEITGVFKKPL